MNTDAQLKNIRKAQEALMVKRESGEHWGNWLINGLKSASLRESINAHCYMCMGGNKDDLQTKSSITRLIDECTSTICPLNTVRPRRK
jgi:hypothetical protein